MSSISELGFLFAAAFLAATILPAQSELVLAGLHAGGHYAPWLLVGIATVGNVLGACVNWLLGRTVERFKGRRWFPVSERALDKAAQHYRRYGVWSLLFSWVPFVGDPLTVMAGVLRTPFYLFLPLVALGKLARYAVIVGVLG